MWVHTQPPAGPDNREDPTMAQGPANFWRCLLVQAPSSYTPAIATAHRGQGESSGDTWDEAEGEQKAEGAGVPHKEQMTSDRKHRATEAIPEAMP